MGKGENISMLENKLSMLAAASVQKPEFILFCCFKGFLFSVNQSAFFFLHSAVMEQHKNFHVRIIHQGAIRWAKGEKSKHV